MKWKDDDLRMGPPNMAGDLIAERNDLRARLAMIDNPDRYYTIRRARGALPCPFCGSKKLKMEVDAWGEPEPHTKYAHVRCWECSAHGPDIDEDQIEGRGLIKKATALWNKRTKRE